MSLLPHLCGAWRRARRIGAPLVSAAACGVAGHAGFDRPLLAQPAPAAGTGDRVSGAVRDSTSGQPLPGAVVQLRDSLDHTVGESVTDERGRFSLTGSPAGRRVRVVRLGYRPADRRVTLRGAPSLEVALVAVPPLLAPARVSAAAGCPRNTNTAAALGLLGQVRAGLLATVIGGAQLPQALTLLSYVREYAPGDDVPDVASEADANTRIVRQTVRMQTSGGTAAPFGASRTGAAFVSGGFRQDSAGRSRYFAPDAGTLADDGFAAGYCFRVVRSDDRNRVGLGFAVPRQRDGRVDVDGVLWVDTVARSLRELGFRYVGLPPNVTALRPGGRLSFRDMPTGATFVDRWLLRLVDRRDAAGDRARGGSAVHGTADAAGHDPATDLAVQEVGSELAEVVWPDGRTWRAPLGAWHLQLTDQRAHPAAGAVVRLEGTDYVGTADSAGVVDFAELLPGPYTASVVDPRLDTLGRGKPVERRAVVTRGAPTDTRLTVAMAERVVAAPSAAPVTLPGVSVNRRKRDTSSVAGRDGDTIEQLFAGRFAGVTVAQAANGGLQIRIRGVTSFGNTEEPLYIVDGTPIPQGMGGIVFINPYDVEKIEVLKNAQDVGVYGIRGGNGVILITTKKGRSR